MSELEHPIYNYTKFFILKITRNQEITAATWAPGENQTNARRFVHNH
jgi:hypothetical protein